MLEDEQKSTKGRCYKEEEWKTGVHGDEGLEHTPRAGYQKQIICLWDILVFYQEK